MKSLAVISVALADLRQHHGVLRAAPVLTNRSTTPSSFVPTSVGVRSKNPAIEREPDCRCPQLRERQPGKIAPGRRQGNRIWRARCGGIGTGLPPPLAGEG